MDNAKEVGGPQTANEVVAGGDEEPDGNGVALVPHVETVYVPRIKVTPEEALAR